MEGRDNWVSVIGEGEGFCVRVGLEEIADPGGRETEEGVGIAKVEAEELRPASPGTVSRKLSADEADTEIKKVS